MASRQCRGHGNHPARKQNCQKLHGDTPVRITESRWFIHKHDDVSQGSIAKAQGLKNCAACHADASEAPSRGRRERHRCLLRQGRYRLAEKAFSVTLARLQAPLKQQDGKCRCRHPPPCKRELPHVLIVLIRGQHSYALFGRRLPLYAPQRHAPAPSRAGSMYSRLKRIIGRRSTATISIWPSVSSRRSRHCIASRPVPPAQATKRLFFPFQGNGYGASRTGAGDPEKPSGSRQDRASRRA